MDVWPGRSSSAIPMGDQLSLASNGSDISYTLRHSFRHLVRAARCWVGPQHWSTPPSGITRMGPPALIRDGLARFCTTIVPKPTAHGPPRSLCLNNPVMVAGYPAALPGKPSKAPMFTAIRTRRLAQSFRNKWQADAQRLSD